MQPNYRKIMTDQHELDSFIADTQGVQVNDMAIIQKKVVALVVEVGECMNEWQGFKYWKVNNAPKRLTMLEEYADILAFAFGVGYSLGATNHLAMIYNAYEAERGKSIQHHFMKLYSETMALYDHLDGIKKPSNEWGLHEVEKVGTLAAFVIIAALKLGAALGIDENTMSELYYTKRAINVERQNTGY